MTQKQQETINEQWVSCDNAIVSLAKIAIATRSPKEKQKLDEATFLLEKAKEILAELSPNI